MEFSSSQSVDADELVALYRSVGWSAYTDDPDGLVRAVANSTFVITARDPTGRLVGLARAISDDVSIVYLQDVLVEPAQQRNGIGRALLRRCFDRFAHVRQRVLLTDDQPHQHRLYEGLGFHDVARLGSARLYAFVDIRGVDLDSPEPAPPM